VRGGGDDFPVAWCTLVSRRSIPQDGSIHGLHRPPSVCNQIGRDSSRPNIDPVSYHEEVDAVFLHTAYRPAHFGHIVFPGKANTGKFRMAEALKRIDVPP
jgi:hypothetical protein